MKTNRVTACLLVISVQAVDQYRKDPRFNQVIYGRVTVTGQQFPAKTRQSKRLLTQLYWQTKKSKSVTTQVSHNPSD